jgi:serine/threonine-protein kinase
VPETTPTPTSDTPRADGFGLRAAAHDSLLAGAQVGDYLVTDLFAKGGFGTIWRAAHRESGAPAALKVLHADLVSSDEIVARFEQEARAINLLRHPNVVDFYDFGRLPDGRPYYVMELLAGESLEAYLRTAGARPPTEVVAILTPLCDALAAAHDHNIVHRDLKASNVVLCDDAPAGARRIVLLDFGIAKIIEAGGPDLTASRCTVGTPSCMAPEQIRGEPVDPRTDVYALGSLIYQMLTGEAPFSGSPPFAAQFMHLHGRRPHPTDRVDIAPAFDEIVGRAMAKDRADRYAGARELLAAFRAVVERPSVARAASAPRLGLAVLVEVRVDPAALDEPSDSLLDDMESARPRADAALLAAGFLLVQETGTSTLFVRTLPDDAAAALAIRKKAVAAVAALWRAHSTRAPADARVELCVCLHVDVVWLDGPAIDGGPLFDTSWAPETGAGVFATVDVLDGTDVVSDRHRDGLRRLQFD